MKTNRLPIAIALTLACSSCLPVGGDIRSHADRHDRPPTNDSPDLTRDFSENEHYYYADQHAGVNCPEGQYFVRYVTEKPDAEVAPGCDVDLKLDNYTITLPLDSLRATGSDKTMRPLRIPCNDGSGAVAVITALIVSEHVGSNLAVSSLTVSRIEGYLFTRKIRKTKKQKS